MVFFIFFCFIQTIRKRTTTNKLRKKRGKKSHKHSKTHIIEKFLKSRKFKKIIKKTMIEITSTPTFTNVFNEMSKKHVKLALSKCIEF